MFNKNNLIRQLKIKNNFKYYVKIVNLFLMSNFIYLIYPCLIKHILQL